MSEEDKYVYTCYRNGMKTTKEVEFDATWPVQLEEFIQFLNGCGYQISHDAMEAAVVAATEVNNPITQRRIK